MSTGQTGHKPGGVPPKFLMFICFFLSPFWRRFGGSFCTAKYPRTCQEFFAQFFAQKTTRVRKQFCSGECQVHQSLASWWLSLCSASFFSQLPPTHPTCKLVLIPLFWRLSYFLGVWRDFSCFLVLFSFLSNDKLRAHQKGHPCLVKGCSERPRKEWKTFKITKRKFFLYKTPPNHNDPSSPYYTLFEDKSCGVVHYRFSRDSMTSKFSKIKAFCKTLCANMSFLNFHSSRFCCT